MRKRSRNTGRLSAVHIPGRSPKVGLGCGFNSENSIPQLHRIQVKLKNAVFGEEKFESLCQDKLPALSEKRPTLREVEIPSELLREGASPSQPIPVLPGILPSRAKGFPIGCIAQIRG